MKAQKVLFIIVLMVLLQGCYTQFATMRERYPQSPDKVAGDSTGEQTRDTVIIKEREVCYWHRTFFGDWELRCYETNYSDSWYSYYNRPWWYYQSSYNRYRCSCPYHISFHSHCDYCWYYCDRYNYFPQQHPPFNSTGGTTMGTGTGPGTGTVNAEKKAGRPSIRPSSPKKTVGSTSGAVQDKPSGIVTIPVEVIGEDKNVTGINQDNDKKIPLEVHKKDNRRSLMPLTIKEKKDATLPVGKEKKVFQKEKAPKKTPDRPDYSPGLKKKDQKIENTSKKKEQKKQSPRKRRSLRGK